ncbi:MAG: hypothetical protein SNJ70_08830 [Armatimonadota bacterium]
MGASTMRKLNKSSNSINGSKSSKRSNRLYRKKLFTSLTIFLLAVTVVVSIYVYINGYAKFSNIGYQRIALKRELIEQQRLNSTLNAEYIRLKSPGRLAEFAQAANMTDRSDRDHIRESELIASSIE